MVASVSTQVAHNNVCIWLRGELTEVENGRLRAVLIDAILHRRPHNVVVDLSEATALDPTTLGALIAASDLAPEHKVRWRVRCPAGTIATALEAAGLERSDAPNDQD